MAKTRKGLCKLCLKEDNLSRSHIISELLYKTTYDADGRMMSVTSEPRYSERPVEVGHREHLLCNACEQRLSKYETASAEFVRSVHAGSPDEDVDLDATSLYYPYEYETLKLFGLAQIWRAHVANRPGFSSFTVGNIADDLRRMLLNGEPGMPHQYPFSVLRVVGSKTADRLVALDDSTGTFRGNPTVALIAHGLQWIFLTTREPTNLVPELSDIFVGYAPMLRVLVRRYSEREFLEFVASKWPSGRAGVSR